ISAPVPSGPGTTMELFDMVCALNGATLIPCRAKARHRALVTRDFPASEEVPATSSPCALLIGLPQFAPRSGGQTVRSTRRRPVLAPAKDWLGWRVRPCGTPTAGLLESLRRRR